MTELRRIVVGVVAAAALLGTAGVAGTAATASADRHLDPRSCHDGGQPHAHTLPSDGGCPLGVV